MPRLGGCACTGGIPFEIAGWGSSGVDGGDGCVDAFLTFSAFCCVGSLVGAGRDDEFGGLKGVYLGADFHRMRHVEGWWEKLLVGRRDVLGSCGYIRRFFKLFWIEFGADGMCGSWTTEWHFERTDGVLWWSLGGEVGQIPVGNGGLLGGAPILDDDF